MAFKMRGAPFQKSVFKDAGHGGDTFHVHESAQEKAQRDIDLIKSGATSGRGKDRQGRKVAREMRQWTDLPSEQKYERQTKREEKKFTRRYGEGQEGLDKFKKKQQKKRKRKTVVGKVTKAIGKVVGAINPFDAKSKSKRTSRKSARKTSARVSGNRSGAGSGCEKTGSCGAFD